MGKFTNIEKNGPLTWEIIHIVVYSLIDFVPARERLLKYVFPEVNAWCENWKLSLLDFYYDLEEKAIREGLRFQYARQLPITLFIIPDDKDAFFSDIFSDRKFISNNSYAFFYQQSAQPEKKFLQQFGEQVKDDLKKKISLLFQDKMSQQWSGSENEEWEYHQQRFIAFYSWKFVGRGKILQQLFKYVNSKSQNTLLVYGEEGIGKTALLAYFYKSFFNASNVIVAHFIKESIRPRNLLKTFEYIRWQLSKCDCFERPTSFGIDKPSSFFNDIIPKIGVKKKVVIIIDGLEFLDDIERIQLLEKLPEKLPENIKIIISLRKNNTKQISSSKHYKKVELKALKTSESVRIMRRNFHYQLLSDRDIRSLLQRQKIGNPLYLKLVLEELRLSRNIAQIPGKITKMFAFLLEQLEREYPSNHSLVVEMLFSLLVCSRGGLLESELRELLVGEDTDDVCSPILYRVRHYLYSKEGKLDFGHQKFAEAVKERYIGEDYEQWHQFLALYFKRQPCYLDTNKPNKRKLEELLWHQIHGEMLDNMVITLCDIEFLVAKVESGLFDELATEFVTALEKIPKDYFLQLTSEVFVDYKIIDLLRLLFYKIAIHSFSIPKEKNYFLDTLLSYCYWYDHPDAGKHYHNQGIAIPPWKTSGTKLYQLIEYWRSSQKHLFRLRSPSDNALRLDSPYFKTIGDKECFSIGICPGDNEKIYISSSEVCCWNWKNGQKSYLDDGEKAQFSFDGKLLVAVHGRSLFNARYGQSFGKPLAEFSANILSMNCCPVSLRVVLGFSDTGVVVIELRKGRTEVSLVGHDNSVLCVAFSPNGSLIASGGQDKTLFIWKRKTGRAICSFTSSTPIHSVCFTPDGKFVITGNERGNIEIWDIKKEERIRKIPVCGRAITSIIMNKSGSEIISGSLDGNICFWDFASGKNLQIFNNSIIGDIYKINDLRLSVDEKILFCAGKKGVRIWDAQNKSANYPHKTKLHKF